MRTVRYHPEARAEFLHEVEYYAAISTRLAELYDKAVHTAKVQAAATPEAWPKYGQKTRRVIDRRFKFSLVYWHSEGEISMSSPLRPRRRSRGTGEGGSVTHNMAVDTDVLWAVFRPPTVRRSLLRYASAKPAAGQLYALGV